MKKNYLFAALLFAAFSLNAQTSQTIDISTIDGTLTTTFEDELVLDVDLFASEMLVSRSQLYSKLKAITNLSANEFINTYRLKQSYALLEQGELQISEIAYETGFNDPKYFSRIFRKYFQEKPSEVLRKR